MTREDYEASEDDNQLVTGVAGDKGGLGYFGFSYYEQNQDKLNLVGVGEDAGSCVKPQLRDDPGRLLQAALAPAVHVPQREGASRGPRSRRSWTSSSPTRPTIAKAAQIVPLTDEQLDQGQGRPQDGRGLAVARRFPSTDPGTAAAAPGAVAVPDQPGPDPHGALARRERDQGRRCSLAAILSVVTTVLIVLSLLRETISFFGDVPIQDYLFGDKWTPLLARRPAVLRRHPAHLGHALPDRHRPARRDPARAPVRDLPRRSTRPRGSARSIKPILEMLAGVPTIVFGYFALTFFTPERHPRARASTSTSSTPCRPGIILGLLVLPTIASVAEDAMSAVPALAARGRVRARRLQAAGLAADRLPGRALGHRRRARARRLARRRRDRDHPDRRRPDRQPRRRPARVLPVDGGVHRGHVARRHPDRLDRVRDDLRRRLHALRDDAAAQRASRSGSSGKYRQVYE